MAAPTLTVAILAGGAATRLGGRDKGLEALDGRPLIEWVVDAIAGMDAFKFSASREGLGGNGVRSGVPPIAAGVAPILRENVLIVANRHREDYARLAHTIGDEVAGFHGPLAGVAAALRACATAWLLTLPVDCPDPPSDLADRLLGCALQSGASCVTVRDGERRQPLFAVYRRELAPSAAAAIEAGQGVWQWQESIRAHELDFAGQRRQFENLNTPEDFAAYAKLRHAC